MSMYMMLCALIDHTQCSSIPKNIFFSLKMSSSLPSYFSVIEFLQSLSKGAVLTGQLSNVTITCSECVRLMQRGGKVLLMQQTCSELQQRARAIVYNWLYQEADVFVHFKVVICFCNLCGKDDTTVFLNYNQLCKFQIIVFRSILFHKYININEIII